MDRATSFALGRPCAIQDEDFDIDLPTECDDEHWAHADAELAFKQPPGRPSKVAFFNCFVRLHQILAFAMRTIYSINKSKALLGFVGQQWEQHIVAELDSALNKWIDSVPDHLRWDPTRENLLFLNQSANLHANYYQLQIAVHRPFIPSPRKPSPLSFPSLAICTNAARSCIHVLDVQYNRAGVPLYSNQMALFTAGIVLLLNIWGGKRSGLSTDPAKEMADVHKCMKMLRTLEPRWHTAGRLWDILYELASVGDLPLPHLSPAPSNKRERDSDSPVSSGAVSIASDSPRGSGVTDSYRAFAGNRRPLPRPLSTHPNPASSDSEKQVAAKGSGGGAAPPSFALPVHTDELGRLPVHPGFNVGYSGEWQPSQQPPQPQPQAGAAPPPFDPRMMGLYALQPPSFNEMFGASMQEPSAFTQAGPEVSMGAGPAAGAAQGPPLSSEEMAFADNTLAMWSNAPSSFEWDDWGTYINNVSGMHNHPGAAGPPPPPGPGPAQR
ncbi:transcription factor [Ganoderma sinense ZZ0214-1]|uniref:Transcription factor n=1 Tax=Ganoderma sinense ZZ0214-1 TaxID=1077348 RepID=A0A2G8RZ57_9APHY|nr:transcription factor [Ganoderma sinense ZZ0214-1]